MQVLFVRHGETLLNRKHVHQSPCTPITEKGRVQACDAARYLKSRNPERLLTSDYTRAVETARVIGSTIEIESELNQLFREIERPSVVCGTSHFSYETCKYIALSVLHRKDPTWRYKDSENFSDIYFRIQNALAYIESLQAKNSCVVVVSHAIFINLLLAYMCHGRVLAFRDLAASFLHIKKMKNAQIAEVRYVGGDADCACKWERVT